MKQVFKNANELSHVFANQLQPSGRANSVFFYNKTIYSYGYHFPMAKFINNQTLLFTERSYSNTTAKHISILRSAVSHKELIYCYNPEATKEDNFNYWLKCAEVTAQSLVKAKKPEKYLNELSIIQDKAQKYANTMQCEIPANLLLVLSIQNKDSYLTYNDAKVKLQKKEDERKAKELKKLITKDKKDFMLFKRNTMYYRNNEDFIRFNVIDNRFETSQGVQIPYEVAKEFCTNLPTLKEGDNVLRFSVIQVDKKLLKIGCHTFKMQYIKQLSNKYFNL